MFIGKTKQRYIRPIGNVDKGCEWFVYLVLLCSGKLHSCNDSKIACTISPFVDRSGGFVDIDLIEINFTHSGTILINQRLTVMEQP